eukprot:scaffold113400_cov22-Tisochrysis_lutea.AAC.3
MSATGRCHSSVNQWILVALCAMPVATATKCEPVNCESVNPSCAVRHADDVPLLHTLLLQRIHHRPLSPDVLEIDGKHMHYKFPWGPLSSIANRVTGVALSVGEWDRKGKGNRAVPSHKGSLAAARICSS